MANFGTEGERNLRPLDNSQTIVRELPHVQPGEIAADYSRRGEALASTIRFADTVINIDAENQYNKTMPQLRDQLNQAAQSVIQDPRDYANAKANFSAQYGSILSSVAENESLMPGVRRELAKQLQLQYADLHAKVNNFWYTNYKRDTAQSNDNNVNSIINGDAALDPRSELYKAHVGEIGQTRAALTTNGMFLKSVTDAMTTGDLANHDLTNAKRQLIINPDRASALIGKTQTASVYQHLTADQWTALRKVADDTLKAHRAQAAVGALMQGKEATQSLLNGGPGLSPAQYQSVVSQLTPEQAAEFKLHYGVAADVGGTLAALKSAPTATWDSAVQTAYTDMKAGGPHSIEATMKYDALKTAADARMSAIKKDPAAYAQSTGLVPPFDPQHIHASIAAQDAWNKTNGVTNGDVVPKPVIQSIVAQYANEPDAMKAAGQLNQLYRRFGPDLPKVAPELFGKDGLPPSAQFYTPGVDPVDFARLRMTDKYPSFESMKGALDNQGIDSKAITAATTAQFKVIAPALGYAADSKEFGDVFNKLTAQIMLEQGANRDQNAAVAEAYNTLFGQYDYHGTWMFPKEYAGKNNMNVSEQDIMDYGNDVISKVVPQGYTEGSAVLSQVRSGLLGHASWQFLPTQRQYVLMDGGLPVRDAFGKLVSFTLDQVDNHEPWTQPVPDSVTMPETK